MSEEESDSSPIDSDQRKVISKNVHMFDSEGCYDDAKMPEEEEEENSLVTSMNGEVSKPECRRMTGLPKAPLVS